MSRASWAAWFDKNRTLLGVFGALLIALVAGLGNTGSRLNGIDVRFDVLNARLDAMQAENTSRYDAVIAGQASLAEALRAGDAEFVRQLRAGLDRMLEALGELDSSISRLEGEADTP